MGWKNSKAKGERDMGFSKARPWGARGCPATTMDRTNEREESKGSVREKNEEAIAR